MSHSVGSCRKYQCPGPGVSQRGRVRPQYARELRGPGLNVVRAVVLSQHGRFDVSFCVPFDSSDCFSVYLVTQQGEVGRAV